MEEKQKLTDVKDLLIRFNSTIDEVYRREIIRLNWRDIMMNKSIPINPQNGQRRGLLFDYHKKFRAFSRALVLYALLKQNVRAFVQGKDRVADEIKDLDLELSNRIRYFNMPSSLELEWLKPIADMLNSNTAVGIQYIIDHSQDILTKLKTFNDKKTEYELRRLVIEISGEEIAELNKCLGDLERWTKYMAQFNAHFVRERFNLYFKGGIDRTNVNYLGLASHFKDIELARQVTGIPQIRSLFTYQQQLAFLNDAIYIAREALKRPRGFYKKADIEFRINEDNTVDYRRAGSRDRWKFKAANAEAFVRDEIELEEIQPPEDSESWNLFLGTERHNYRDGFIYNLRKGKKYIEMVQTQYGNNLFAGFLDETEQRFYQSPVDWYRELTLFASRFNTMVNRDIETAKIHLISSFNERIKYLQGARNSTIDKARQLLNSRLVELENAKASVKKSFEAILKKHRKKIISEWNREKIEYESKEDVALLQIWAFNEKADRFLARVDRRKVYAKYRATLKANLRTEFFLQKALARIKNNPDNETVLDGLEIPIIYALHKSYRQEIALEDFIDRIEHMDIKDLEELKSLIVIGYKLVMPTLKKLEIEINRLINKYCLPEARQFVYLESQEYKQLAA